MPDMPISRYLDTVGDGTGSHSAVGDYSVTPATFKLAPAAGQTFQIHRLIVFIEDTTMRTDRYGADIVLTNGVEMKVTRQVEGEDEEVLWDITAQTNIFHNADWKALCHDEIVSNYGAGANNVAGSYRFTFTNDGKPITLNGDNNEELRVILNDNFTGLVEHRFKVGFIEE